MSSSSSFPITDGPLNFGSLNTNYTLAYSESHSGFNATWTVDSGSWETFGFRREEEQTIIIEENTAFNISLELTWSVLSGKIITHSTSLYNSEAIPTWITIDLVEDRITGDSPNVNQNETYRFYVDSTWTDVPPTAVQQTSQSKNLSITFYWF